ncbi:MAG: hypothetical protein IVW57_16490 [Ktedonobacterales bacterium]|nr:hypothetical protein [Ktedonobacterales bacterium]
MTALIIGLATGSKIRKVAASIAASIAASAGVSAETPVIGWFVSTAADLTAPVLTSLKVLFIAIEAEAGTLFLLFWAQANLWSDSWWRSRVAFGAWVALASVAIFAASLVVAAEAAVVVDTLGGGPEDPVGDIAAAIAGAIGLTLNLAAFGLPATLTLNAEYQALYPDKTPSR